MKDNETEKLGKLIEVAKRGSKNEKAIAIKFIKKICKKHDLVFEDVMLKKEVKIFELDIKMKKYKDLMTHIYSRYGVMDDNKFEFGGYRSNKSNTYRIWYKTTLARHIEMINAFDVLHRIYDKEYKLVRESFALAFMNKHKLWHYVENIDDDLKKKSKEELKKERIARDMMDNLQSVKIQKQITGTKSGDYGS